VFSNISILYSVGLAEEAASSLTLSGKQYKYIDLKRFASDEILGIYSRHSLNCFNQYQFNFPVFCFSLYCTMYGVQKS